MQTDELHAAVAPTRRPRLLPWGGSLALIAALSVAPALLRAETPAAPDRAADVAVVERAAVEASPATSAPLPSFLGVEQLLELRTQDPELILIDARPAEQYATGHIPGAINLPGAIWRTPSAKPDKGDSQYFFRTEDGSPDVGRYEKLLSEAGLTREATVVVYGDHAGKTDGSVPLQILRWLGHERSYFLDGLGFEQWKAAGQPVSTEPTARSPATYVAAPVDDFVWNLDDVLAHIGNDDVIFYDTRSPKEFTGADKRDNARGGHIPGAVNLDYDQFLDKQTKRLLPRETLLSLLAERQISPEKTVVLYCQTATRTSLPLLVLQDLGYRKIAVYDASWHEYGNLPETPVATEE